MRYIWEVFFKAENEDVYICQADVVSPYYEMEPHATVTDGVIEYNPMYRYEDIFGLLLAEGGLSPELEKWYIDILTHYLARVDIMSGMSVDEYRRRECMKKMKDGTFGEEIKNVSSQVEDSILYQVSVYYILAQKTHATLSLFSKALISIMETGVLYQDKDEQDVFYYYVGRAENTKDTATIQLVKWMLLPVGKEMRIFWNHHFGICGQDITMLDNEIVII